MSKKPEFIGPAEIEKRSMEIIEGELKERYGGLPDPVTAPVIKRVIHTTADFSFAESLVFSKDAVMQGVQALRHGATVVTDTMMAMAGINKRRLEAYGGKAVCFMQDEEVARKAAARGVTRAAVSMEKAAGRQEDQIYVIGNAPTALLKLYDKIQEGAISPKLIIGVPVGFVNVEEAKELILTLEVPYIVARGRRGGSNVAAAIVNALLYYDLGDMG